MGKVVEIDCEKSMKLETSPKVTKSKRSLHWCCSISKKLSVQVLLQYQSKSYYISGRRFITVAGVVLHYQAVITLSGVVWKVVHLLILVNLMEPLRGSTTVYALYRHTLPFQGWKSIMTCRARIITRYLYV